MRPCTSCLGLALAGGGWGTVLQVAIFDTTAYEAVWHSPPFMPLLTHVEPKAWVSAALLAIVLVALPTIPGPVVVGVRIVDARVRGGRVRGNRAGHPRVHRGFGEASHRVRRSL